MPQLNIIFLILFSSICWLIFRRLFSHSLLMRFSIICLMSILFSRPLIGEGFFLYPKIIFENLIFIAGFLILVSKCQKDKPKMIFSLIDKIFLLFITMLIVGLSGSVNLLVAIDQLIYFFSIYVLYWSIKNLPDDDLIRGLLLKTFILCGFLLMCYAVHQYTTGFDQMRDFLKSNPQYNIDSGEFAKRVNQNLIFATFIYPPAFGDYLSMLFLTSLGITCMSSSDLKKINSGVLFKYMSLLLALCIIPILIMTKSKGAWVSLFAALTLFYFLNKSSSKTVLKPIYALMLFMLCFLGIGLFHKTALPNFKNFIISYEIRLEYWKAALMMIREHPLLGFGPGTFAITYPGFKTKLAEETIMAHNSFLQLWAESGFFSLIFFSLFAYRVFSLAVKNKPGLKPLELGIFAAFFSFLFQNLFDFGLFDAQRSTVAFGLLGIYSLIRQKEGGHILIDRKKKAALIITCAILLFIIIIYSANIYLGKKFDAKSAQALKAGDLNQAADFSDKAIRFNPLSADYFYHRAYIYENMAGQSFSKQRLRLDLINESISNYLKAINLNSYVSYYHLRLAKLLFVAKQGNYEQQTLFHLKLALKMYPVNPFYHEQLAEFYGIIGKQSAAEDELNKAKVLKKYFKKGTRD